MQKKNGSADVALALHRIRDAMVSKIEDDFRETKSFKAKCGEPVGYVYNLIEKFRERIGIEKSSSESDFLLASVVSIFQNDYQKSLLFIDTAILAWQHVRAEVQGTLINSKNVDEIFASARESIVKAMETLDVKELARTGESCALKWCGDEGY